MVGRRVRTMLLALGLVSFILLGALPSSVRAGRRLGGYGYDDWDEDYDCGKECEVDDCTKAGHGRNDEECVARNCTGEGCVSCIPLKQCDFFFSGHEQRVPVVKLIREGEKVYTEIGHIVHKDGDVSRPVSSASSVYCELRIDGKWNKQACHHRLYTNGRHVASRPLDDNFLDRCIKVFISSAEYEDGGSYNGENKPRSCVAVRASKSFA